MKYNVGEKVYPSRSSKIYGTTTYGNGYGIVANCDDDYEMTIMWVTPNGKIVTTSNEAVLYTVESKHFSNRNTHDINDYDIYTELDNPNIIPGIRNWLAIIVIKDTDTYLTLRSVGSYMLSNKRNKPLDGISKVIMYDLFCKVHGKDVIENGLEGE